jgi:hypothetical protein
VCWHTAISKLGERKHDVGTNTMGSMKLLSFSLPLRSLQRLALLAPICIAFNTHQLINEFDLGARQIQDTMGLFLKKHSHIIERLAPAKNHAEAQFDIDTMTMTSFQYSGIGSGEKVSLAESAETSPSSHPIMDIDDDDSTDEADFCNGVIMDIEDDDELYTTDDMSDSLINTMSACIG